MVEHKEPGWDMHIWRHWGASDLFSLRVKPDLLPNDVACLREVIGLALRQLERWAEEKAKKDAEQSSAAYSEAVAWFREIGNGGA